MLSLSSVKVQGICMLLLGPSHTCHNHMYFYMCNVAPDELLLVYERAACEALLLSLHASKLVLCSLFLFLVKMVGSTGSWKEVYEEMLISQVSLGA